MHKSVLLTETIESLNIHNGEIVFDGTLGAGGHSGEILSMFSGIQLVGTDLDLNAINICKEKFADYVPKPILVNKSYTKISSILKDNKIESINKAMLDLGVSSMQLDATSGGNTVGFSFNKDEPLIMRFGDTESDLTAMEVVNDFSEEEIADIIFKFGEERKSRYIAKAIVDFRKKQKIETSKQLGDLVSATLNPNDHYQKIHPATKTFQALRIFVNKEFENVENGINEIIENLAKEGRLAVITFHSSEDRIVKNIFKQKEKDEIIKIFNKKVIKPQRKEILENKRSRSAKLRTIIKI